MKKHLIILTFILTLIFPLFSQNIPQNRITNWENPGCANIFTPQNNVSLNSFGADTSGIMPSDTALLQAISALNGPGEIFVPKGTYLFNQKIILPDSIIIQGETDTLTHASLANFKLSPGTNNHGININGTETYINCIITHPLSQDDQKIVVDQAGLFAVGDFIDLKAYDDSLLVYSTWAYHTTGQIVQIKEIVGDSLMLNKPLRRSYSQSVLPYIYKLIPRRQVHLKCINIERLDSVSTQSANIFFYCAVDCSVSGVQSYMCNYAHVDMRNCSRITVENSYFKDAFSYGSDGKGYGVIVQSTSSDCYVHQNNFNHCRHSMILQSGSNGNVFAYNYSKDPYWTGTSLPSDAAGDIVMHGNYPYMNLFEGNVIQNIVIDNSHGINGPFNTLYRNRAELYGIFMNPSPASNQQNFIGNQITNTTSISLGQYYLQGTDHFEYGNMVKGNILPAGTIEPTDTSMFHYTFPSFYQNISSIPPIKTSNWQSLNPLIEVDYRFQVTNRNAICNEIYYSAPSGISEIKGNDEFVVYPNPFANEFSIKNLSNKKGFQINILNSLGQNIYSAKLKGENNTINTKDFDSGIYFLSIQGKEKTMIKLLKY